MASPYHSHRQRVAEPAFHDFRKRVVIIGECRRDDVPERFLLCCARGVRSGWNTWQLKNYDARQYGFTAEYRKRYLGKSAALLSAIRHLHLAFRGDLWL
jgi:hypothetical protein